jgi:hypothetical protein
MAIGIHNDEAMKKTTNLVLLSIGDLTRIGRYTGALTEIEPVEPLPKFSNATPEITRTLPVDK